MIIVRSCSLSAIACLLAPLLNQPFNPVEERLRDTYQEADAKIARNIAIKHGGRVFLQNHSDGGLVAMLELSAAAEKMLINVAKSTK